MPRKFVISSAPSKRPAECKKGTIPLPGQQLQPIHTWDITAPIECEVVVEAEGPPTLSFLCTLQIPTMEFFPPGCKPNTITATITNTETLPHTYTGTLDAPFSGTLQLIATEDETFTSVNVTGTGIAVGGGATIPTPGDLTSISHAPLGSNGPCPGCFLETVAQA